jgi:hypothetical protein
MSTGDLTAQNRSGHAGILALCWIIYGIFRICVAVWMIGFSGTATLMFGALLNRVANPEALMADFHLFYTASIVLSAVCGVLGILAGLALLVSRPIGRVLALIAGFLSVSHLPLGTTLGIYTLIVFLRRDANQLDR